MKLHSSQIVTAIVTAIVTVSVLFVVPAAAEVLTVCANPAQSSAGPERFPTKRLADAIIPLSGRTSTDDDTLVALWQDDDGFDILMNWGESSQHSLRKDGAQIIGMAPDLELVHLMVAHADGGLEHFLFDLDGNGSGELLRTGATAGAPPVSSNAVCVKPH